MKIENLCIKCMKEKASPEGRCEHCGYDPAEDTIPPHHLSPFVILEGKYLVGKSIGEGGFGITYIGMDLNLEMRVAIKEYYPNGCAIRDTSGNSCTVQSYSGEAQTFFETGREKFINEAKILAKCIDLPEIVTVKDFFKENHTAYIVMEFLEGQTLKAYLKERGGRISATETLNMMKPLIRSLGQVHKMNLIHRDISPDNIMITTNYEVKILDFGGARDFGSARGRSMSIMLKPGYAPEEQYRTHGEQGPWTDVYALCATMYRCITGQIPPESMERTYQDHLRPVTDFQPDCPREVNFAICKGLSVYKDDRWQSMEELYDCLYNGREVTESEEILVPDNRNNHNNYNNRNNRAAREEGQVRGKQYYPQKKNNMLPIMAGILGVVLIALLAIFGVNYYKSKSDSKETTAGPTETTAQVRPMLALTFDDGPGQYTDELLDCLEENNAHATFFMLGQNVSAYPDAPKRMLELGCEIGSHSWDHTQLTTISIDAVAKQFSDTDDALVQACGQAASVARAPYGDGNTDIYNTVNKPFFMWSLDTEDWKLLDADGDYNAVMNGDLTDGSIIMMHDIHEPSVKAALRLIPDLIAQGYKLVTVSEMAEAKNVTLQNASYVDFWPSTLSNGGVPGYNGGTDAAAADSTDSTDSSDTSSSGDGSDQTKNSETENKSEEEPTPTSTPTPIPTPTKTPKVAYINMDHIQDEVFGSKGSGAQESLYMRDCMEDAPRGTDEKNTAMPATGMVSVPILYTLAVKMDDPNSGITLNTPVTFQYTYDTASGGRGYLTSSQAGQQMSIDTLVQEMLMYSDNNATNSLISFLTLEGIQQTCQENKFTSVMMRRQIVKGGTSADDNLISAKDATNMVYDLFMNKFSVINRDYLMNYMRICDNAQRHAIFQSDTLYNGGTFCNQNGIRPNPGSGTYAEVGIILADGQQYVVCVMSDGGDADLAADEFSKAVDYIHECMLETY